MIRYIIQYVPPKGVEMLLTGKVAMVTGAGRGIGREIALTFAREGATVVISDLAKETVEGALVETRAHGGDGMALVMDVTKEGDIRSGFEKLLERYGTLDILVNNAGICRNVKIMDISLDEWNRFLSVNLTSVFLCSKEALKAMMPMNRGKIVNLGSMAGKIGGIVAGAHYSAAKAGVICLTKSLALQAAPFNIQVNGLAPGLIATQMTEEWGEELTKAFIEKIPLKRSGSPADVAEAALFLASNRSDYITGEIIDVNGGLLMD
jgi:3-oxoacyl-[acyl-carrier protein] reductase